MRSPIPWTGILSAALVLLIGLVVYVAFFLPERSGLTPAARRTTKRSAPTDEQPLRRPQLPVSSPGPPSVPGDDGVGGTPTIELGDARFRIERAVVILKLEGEEGRPLRDVRGVVVHPDGVVLCRLQTLLGAYQATAHLSNGRRVLGVIGSVFHDVALDLALVRLDVGEEPLAFVPLLEEVSGVVQEEDRLFVLSGERVKEAVVSEPYFLTSEGLVGLRLADEPRVLAETFLAVDAYGFLVGLCRPLRDGRLVENLERSEDQSYRVLVVPAATPARYVEGLVITTLHELTLQLYEGTFADLENRGRRAYRQKRWPEAVNLLSRAIDRGLTEAASAELDARIEQVGRELRESFLEEVRRLVGADRLAEAEAMVETALGRFPDDPAFWLQLGETKLALGMTREGIVALLELQQLEPGRQVDDLLENAYLNLGAEAQKASNLQLAESIYLEALGRLQGSATLHIELAKIYRDWEAYDDALRLLERAKELDPTLASQIDVYMEKIDDALKRREAVVIPIPAGSSSIRTTVLIDGRDEFKFIVDTGATYTALPERVARALGYDPKQGELMQVKTAGGLLVVRVIRLESLSLQGYTVRNLKAIVLPESVGPTSGLLGLNFLRFFKYQVDSRRREFRLERL